MNFVLLLSKNTYMQPNEIVDYITDVSTKRDYLRYRLNEAIDDRNMIEIIRFNNLLAEATTIMIRLEEQIDKQVRLN